MMINDQHITLHKLEKLENFAFPKQKLSVGIFILNIVPQFL